MQYIIIIGAFQALVAVWLLQVKEKKSPSNYLLMFLLSAIAVHMIIKFVIFGFIPNESIRQQMNTFISVCYGPLIYLYALSNTGSNLSVAGKWYIFIPFFILMIAYITISCVFIILERVDEKLLYGYNNFSMALMFIINLYYPCKSIHIMKTNSGAVNKTEYDVIMKISGCILFLEAVLVISKVLLYIYIHNDSVINIIIRCISYFTLLTISLLIIRKAFITQDIDTDSFQIKINMNSISENVKDFPVHIVDYEQKFNALWHQLDDSVQKGELFRDCDLTLDELAQRTKINKYQISEMLNGYKNKPFYRYINEYRIEYFKNMIEKAIEKDEHINFLSFAYEAGFKSKSSFNRYFKDILGKTPSEYYRNLLEEHTGNSFENLYRGSA
ncbi:AraC family transcriptional regulator [Chryseobacterium sp.]|uniref:helix-turn-helix domain-containing protein n=1 Tax=Chryseobacterium sp. TaxID=1871047 RepID=UPI0025BC7C94|nr:AraC family transcriptional regulator [Chryseobacterium sp.]